MPASIAALRGSRRTSPLAAKVDFRAAYPTLYKAGRSVDEVRVAKGVFLAVDGQGEPGGAAFQEAINKLYSLAYTAKFDIKAASGRDFSVPPLECLWPEGLCDRPRSEWRWRLMLRVPAWLTEQALGRARRIVRERKGFGTDEVRRVAWAEGRSLQVLHVGPYDGVAKSYERLGETAAARGLRFSGPGHEVYLSDPRRTAPEKIRTIVRVGVNKAER
jgi:hypothetical protein